MSTAPAAPGPVEGIGRARAIEPGTGCVDDDLRQSREPTPDSLYIGGAMLVSALANLVVRYRPARHPSPAPRADSD